MGGCQSAPARAGLDRQAAASYVLSRRTPEGGYCFYRTSAWGVEEPNAPDTLAAVESLRLLGVDPPDPSATARFLASLQHEDGGFPTLTIGWAALRGLGALGSQPSRGPDRWLQARWEALLVRDPGRDEGRRWAAVLGDGYRLVEASQVASSGAAANGRAAANGSAGTGSSTGAGEDRRAGLAALLDAAGDPEGGWARPAADLETTGVASRILGSAALPGGSPGTASGAGLGGAGALLRRCEDPVLGLRLAPGTAATSVGAIWGGVATARTLGLELRHPAAVARSLVLLQRPDGGLGARHRAISTLADTWRGLQAAALLDRMPFDPPQEAPR